MKRRVGSYIKNSIKYDRCYLLEGENNHLLIINIDNGLKKAKRIINIYRSFNPNGITERDLFERQLTVIKDAFTSDSILLGDLNLDYNKRFDVNYQRRYLFDVDIYEITVHVGCSVTILSSLLTGLVYVPRVPGLR